MTRRTPGSSLPLHLALIASGAGGLTWEVMWQHHTALALGVSAFGTAVTLACMMAGLGLGALLVSRMGWAAAGLRGYGMAELCVAAGGLLVAPGLQLLAAVDTQLYAHGSALALAVQIVGTALLLLLPAAAMGTTFPLLAPVASAVGARLSLLYAANTLGAVLGVLAATFVAIPLLGVRGTELAAAALDVSVALWALSRGTLGAGRSNAQVEPPSVAATKLALSLAALSGSATFILEVSWFRSVRAAYQATTETFAILVAAFLIAITFGSALVRALPARATLLLRFTLPLAGYAILRSTAAIDGLDDEVTADNASTLAPLLRLLQLGGLLIGPVTLLGTIFPATLETHRSSSSVARLYAVNTLGAVAGALGAGFWLLPSIGATHTSWLAGGALLAAGLLLVIFQRAGLFSIALVAALCAAGLYETRSDADSARHRVQGFGYRDFGPVLFVAEGPDSTVWVTTVRLGAKRALVIDGFEASGESPTAEHYMRFMGTLPSLAAQPLRRALVICFGTGQTANAVRKQGPARLDIADVNANVLRAAPLFSMNEGVLRDPRVHAVVMDGRAFLRRALDVVYDVVTLEPMPPNFAGVNNLYSREFYQLVAGHLSPHGMAAQWLPMHLIAGPHMRAIIATFQESFPHTRLWIDPIGGTGVLVGSRAPWSLHASATPLDLSPVEIEHAFLLDAEQLRRATRGAPIITDDNQLLAYGLDRFTRTHGHKARQAVALYERNLAALQAFASSPAAPPGASLH
ncbi:MAG TPA: fused MFS/spermidine synthase [Polyangiales bacterium]